ncbi:MAG: methyltransferase domain-containing protein [candidate division WOR-3 bacterium]|nr:MAG: methyltransferase domain-containing protein [candidate division WOR-3 bacterium]
MRSSGDEIWESRWSRLTPESEIRMWDFFGLRHWILKYVPRHGIVLDAGCGLGRYVFYLNELGVDCVGVDLSDKAMTSIQEYRQNSRLIGEFCRGSVKSLPFADSSLSGYLSGGVVEHFVEGPQHVLSEAFRVLRPGGIAIISTPSLSVSQLLLQTKTKVKREITKILRRMRGVTTSRPKFFQYWYTPRRLRNFIQSSGFRVVLAKGADVFYSLYELGYIPKRDNLLNKAISRMENTFIANGGAQSITISYKPAREMYCFLCGKLKVRDTLRRKTAVPICDDCSSRSCAKYYIEVGRPRLSHTHIINPVFKTAEQGLCEYCGKKYRVHEIYEYYGFAKRVCPDCVVLPEINIELANEYVQPIWRERGKSF